MVTEFNFSSVINGTYNGGIVEDLTFSDVVRVGCSNWRNQSTNAHNFYFVLICLMIVLNVISYFWNPEIKYNFMGKEYNNFVLLEIKSFLNMILVIRIIQIYLISKIYLGGL